MHRDCSVPPLAIHQKIQKKTQHAASPDRSLLAPACQAGHWLRGLYGHVRRGPGRGWALQGLGSRERNVPQAREAVASRGASPAEARAVGGGGGSCVATGLGGEGAGSRKPPCAC